MTNYCHLNFWTLETECHSVISGLLVCLHQSTRSTPSKLSLIVSACLFFLHYLTTPGKSKAVQGKVQVHFCMNVRPAFEIAQLKTRTAHYDDVVHFSPPVYRSQKGERLIHPRQLVPAYPRNTNGWVPKESFKYIPLGPLLSL